MLFRDCPGQAETLDRDEFCAPVPLKSPQSEREGVSPPPPPHGGYSAHITAKTLCIDQFTPPGGHNNYNTLFATQQVHVLHACNFCQVITHPGLNGKHSKVKPVASISAVQPATAYKYTNSHEKKFADRCHSKVITMNIRSSKKQYR